MDTDLEEEIRDAAAYSAGEALRQLDRNEPAPEEMPEDMVDLEQRVLSLQLGGFTDEAWEIYKEQWEQEMKAHNRRRGNAIG